MSQLITSMQLISGIFDSLQYDMDDLLKDMSEAEVTHFKESLTFFSSQLDKNIENIKDIEIIQDFSTQFLKTFESIPTFESHFSERLTQLKGSTMNERAGDLEYCDEDDFKVYANEIIYAIEVIEKANLIERSD